MNWDELPYRQEDPCNQVEEFFEREIEQPDLLPCLNALSRQGFKDVEHEPLKTDVDEVYQNQTFKVTAWRLVCACKRRLDYLQC